MSATSRQPSRLMSRAVTVDPAQGCRCWRTLVQSIASSATSAYETCPSCETSSALDGGCATELDNVHGGAGMVEATLLSAGPTCTRVGAGAGSSVALPAESTALIAP